MKPPNNPRKAAPLSRHGESRAPSSAACNVGRIVTPPPFSAGGLPLLPPREERAGERRAIETIDCPFPRPSPRSSVAARGRTAGAVSGCARFVLGVALLAPLFGAGCKDSNPPAQVSDTADARQASGSKGQTATTRSTAPASRTPASNARFHPVPLDEFFQRQFADYRPNESWAQVPRGETNFDGVPFLLFGKIDLTGLGRARDGEFQPPGTGEIPVGRRATRLHLMHGTSYDSPEGEPVACLLLRYEGGETRRLLIRYGVHVRNWHLEANEVASDLSDPGSRVVWDGNTRPDGAGKPTRLFKTTFENPVPAKEIRTLQLLSLFARANPVILAITLEDAPGAASQTAPTMQDEDDSSYRREDVVRVLDADTGQAIPNAVLKLSVTEGARTYGFGVHSSDARGEFRIMYPPGKFGRFLMEMTAPGYSPTRSEILSDDGFLSSNLTLRLKRATAP